MGLRESDLAFDIMCVYGNLRIAYKAAIPDRSRWAEKEVQECLIVLMAEPRSLRL